MTLQVQFVTMGTMMLSGIAMGVVFDTYRVLTGQLRISRWLLPLLDLLYWTGVTVFVFRVLVWSNYGQLRFFVFLGLAAGVLLHYILFSGLVIRLVLTVIRAVRWTLRFLYKTFILLIVRPAVGLYRFCLLLLAFLAATAVFLLKLVLKLLYPFRVLGRWLWKITLGRVAWGRYAGWVIRLKSRVIGRIRSFFRK